MKISKAEYLKAKSIVAEYERQITKSNLDYHFTEDDLEIVQYSVQVPSLTMDVIDEDFASNIQSGLDERGFFVDWVSLDDMGYISIKFRNGIITENQILAVLDTLNNINIHKM